MIVGVKYKNERTGKYGGRAYSYNCELEDPKDGDVVVAPVKDGECEAVIVELDVDPATTEGIQLKTITKRAENAADKAEGEGEPKTVNVSLDDLALPDSAHQEAPSIENAIVLKQLPIIEDRMRELGGAVKERVMQACSLVCTEDTYKEIRKVRAQLNKEFNELEEQRKKVKNAILDPYKAFENVYDECVTKPYRQADKQLAERIRGVTDGLLAKKTDEVLKYFEEYRTSKGLDFLEFEHANIRVTMSDSLKKLKEKAKDVIDHVAADVDVIRSMEYAEEILVEYKQDFMLNAALSRVKERHKAIEAAKAAEASRMERAISQKKAEESVQKEIETMQKEERTAILEAPMEKPLETEVKKTVPDEKPVTYTTAFRVVGTLEQLKALKQFLNEGGYEYEQL